MRMARFCPHSAGSPCAHAGHSDIYHHRHAHGGDLFKQRVVTWLIHAEMLHDRMKMESEELQIANGVAGFFDRRITFGRLDRSPTLNDAAMTVAHSCHIIIAALRR